MDNAVGEEVRRLISEGVTSMDHVDFLFHLGHGETSVTELAKATRFNPRLIDSLTADLQKAGLVARRDDAVSLTANARDRGAIAELLAIYNSRPVTLVRAIYAREMLSRTVTEALTPKPIE